MRNEVIYDKNGRPDIMVVFTPSELGLPDTLRGRKVKEYAISKYPNTLIDGVAALFEVCKAMDAERSDLLSYVNVFGYNPKYGVSGKRIERVAYWPQNFNKYMQAPSYTLPAKLRQRRR